MSRSVSVQCSECSECVQDSVGPQRGSISCSRGWGIPGRFELNMEVGEMEVGEGISQTNGTEHCELLRCKMF